ncbi:hypothetical protein PF005_g7848 [Phytophthora fragariae]|nr:hypothetical protein PF007_g9904 [Phytophthora fragariae]KAE9219510.1 hypothetical protein PF005_g7848 [Phytophthora fragariae]
MYEYDVFKRLCDLSGAGWNSEINAPVLDDETWGNLAKAQPRNVSLLKRFREEEFTHANVSSLIAGDSRATALEAGNISDFASQEVVALLHNSGGPATECEGGHTTEDAGGDTNIGEETSTASQATSFSSPTIARRTAQAKRYRDGRKKGSINNDAANAQMTSFFKTAEQYFKMKMELLSRELEHDGRALV